MDEQEMTAEELGIHLPLVVSNYTDEDGKIGIIDQDDQIVVRIWRCHKREVLQWLADAVNKELQHDA
jgi:hypothetical protein